jgi:hypothetical protein
MTLTRKHFEELAHVAADHPEATADLMDFCARHNGRFDRSRFQRRVQELRARKSGALWSDLSPEEARELRAYHKQRAEEA